MMRPCAYLLDGELNESPIRIELRHSDPDSWAVTHRGYCLTRHDDVKLAWEEEPMPSSRDSAFLARARWATVEQAADAYRAWCEHENGRD